MADRISKRPRVDPPPELGPFIEAMAQLLVSDHLRREADHERAVSFKPRRQRASRKMPRLPR